MAQFVIANNVNTQLAAALPSSGAGSTTVVLASSANLPTLNIAIGQMMPLTLNDAATGAIYETVYVTAISGATLTVLRGQEGTSALNWSVGDLAFCGPTAGTSGLTTMRTQYQASAAFSSSQTLTAAIAGESIGFTGSSASTFSMPGQSTVPNLTPTAVYNDGTAALTLTANGSDKFVVSTGQVTSIVMQPGDDFTFYASTTANLWTAASGSALRQYEPLVIGSATQSQHALQLGQAVGRLLAVTPFTAGGTWTPNALTTKVRVRIQAGGGGGGGSGATGAGQVACAGGGGGGAYHEIYIANPGSQTITVGAGGLASGASASAGGTGGTSSFGAIASAAGGVGGGAGAAFTVSGGSGISGGGGAGGALPTSIAGTVKRAAGAAGGVGFGFQVSNANGGWGGVAGDGGGGASQVANAPGASTSSPGGGAGGACGYQSGPAASGGTGGAGYVIVEEYA